MSKMLEKEFTVAEYTRKCPAFFYNFIRIAETNDDTEHFV